MQRLVDFHTHFIPRTLASWHAPGCTELMIESPTCGHLHERGEHYRTIDERSWDRTRRLSDMDQRNVSVQVLSPIPVTNSYASTSAAGAAFARLHNDGIAEMVRARPDRFAGLGAVPLQDVDAACEELVYLTRDLGLLGVEIGTFANGLELDDPAMIPFWEVCDKQRAVVFVHPEIAPGFERHRKSGVITSAAYPSETGIVAAKLLAGGHLERFPQVRIVLAHGGGTLPWLLPRLDRFWEASQPGLRRVDERPSVKARGFFCDSLTFNADNLRLVVDRFGSDRIMVGTDYPFAVMEDPPGDVLSLATFDDGTLAAIRSGTFEALRSNRDMAAT